MKTRTQEDYINVNAFLICNEKPKSAKDTIRLKNRNPPINDLKRNDIKDINYDSNR